MRYPITYWRYLICYCRCLCHNGSSAVWAQLTPHRYEISPSSAFHFLLRVWRSADPYIQAAVLLDIGRRFSRRADKLVVAGQIELRGLEVVAAGASHRRVRYYY